MRQWKGYHSWHNSSERELNVENMQPDPFSVGLPMFTVLRQLSWRSAGLLIGAQLPWTTTWACKKATKTVCYFQLFCLTAERLRAAVKSTNHSSESSRCSSWVQLSSIFSLKTKERWKGTDGAVVRPCVPRGGFRGVVLLEVRGHILHGMDRQFFGSVCSKRSGANV